MSEKYYVRLFNQDKPDEKWMFRCPKCKGLGAIDEDQLMGKVSILCECGFHETIDLTKHLKEYPEVIAFLAKHKDKIFPKTKETP